MFRPQKDWKDLVIIMTMLMRSILIYYVKVSKRLERPGYYYDYAYEKWLYTKNLYSQILDPDIGRYQVRLININQYINQ